MMMMLMMRKAKDIDNAQWKSALDVGGHKNEHIINYCLEQDQKSIDAVIGQLQ